MNPQKAKLIVGTIHGHPKMYVINFSNILNNLLRKNNQQQKTVFLLGNFNIDVMHYNEHRPTNEFLDSLVSDSYLLYIIQPSWHTSLSSLSLLTIFPVVSSEKAISGNITTTISDYLPQFLISPNTFADPPSNKSNVFEGEWSNFDQENFVLDYFDIDWPNILKHVENNIKSVTISLIL